MLEGGTMRKKILISLGVLLVLFAVTSCKSNPEKGLLERYFHAVALNDVTTLSSMALEPVTVDATKWSITKPGEEKIEPASLSDLNAKEIEAKKAWETHTPVVLSTKDDLDNAKDELTSARTGAARAAAQAKVTAAQKKYDDEYARHNEVKKAYNDAKSAAQREEDITNFSLGAGQLANIRELKGEVHSKELEIQTVGKDGAAKNHKILMKMYDLKDDAANVAHRGRWVIIKFEQI
jgi:hypothetical protein